MGLQAPATRLGLAAMRRQIRVLSPYANHHPDQHSFVFYRNAARSNWALSGHDGGVSRTTGINSPTVSWARLNNGYLTTQFYTVAIRNASGDLNIIGGKQDNGTYRGVSSSSTAAWQNIFGGDGSFCAISSSGNPYYVSVQNGIVYRSDAQSLMGSYNHNQLDTRRPAGWFRLSLHQSLRLGPEQLECDVSCRRNNACGETSDLTGIPSLSENPATYGWTGFNLNARS
jgi:hypothetical protein